MWPWGPAEVADLADLDPQELAPKTKVDPSQRNSEANPFKWPGAERYFGGNAVTSTQAQMRGGCKLQFQTITGARVVVVVTIVAVFCSRCCSSGSKSGVNIVGVLALLLLSTTTTTAAATRA